VKLQFEKYHGTGNDFIILNSLIHPINLTTKQIKFLCDRHLGIGADGLMIILPSENYCFKMQYFNSDGNEGTMCGNGGRAISAYAFDHKMFLKSADFETIDGIHQTTIIKILKDEWLIKISLNEVINIKKYRSDFFLNTGSPHHIKFVDDVEGIDIEKLGKKIRWSKRYEAFKGTNVNFVEILKNGIFVRTFERGVEAETLSCGTGVTAAAIALAIRNGNYEENRIHVQTKGGNLEVKFNLEKNGANSITLSGPVKKVFEATVNLII
jgi:diaminopimelate epimerase